LLCLAVEDGVRCFGLIFTVEAGVRRDEADLPAKGAAKEATARLFEADEYPERPKDNQAASPQGKEEADGVGREWFLGLVICWGEREGTKAEAAGIRPGFPGRRAGSRGSGRGLPAAELAAGSRAGRGGEQ